MLLTVPSAPQSYWSQPCIDALILGLNTILFTVTMGLHCAFCIVTIGLNHALSILPMGLHYALRTIAMGLNHFHFAPQPWVSPWSLHFSHESQPCIHAYCILTMGHYCALCTSAMGLHCAFHTLILTLNHALCTLTKALNYGHLCTLPILIYAHTQMALYYALCTLINWVSTMFLAY